MAYANLEEKLQALGGAMEMARNSADRAVRLPGGAHAEFSNWREEQVAWRETSALFDDRITLDADRGPGHDQAPFRPGREARSPPSP